MMQELISRQAAIDVLHGYFDGMLETDTICPKDLYNLFEVLPSAQPELNEWCHECKEYDTEKGRCPRWGQVIRTALDEAKPKGEQE